jgi:pilus assembly protein CpaC
VRQAFPSTIERPLQELRGMSRDPADAQPAPSAPSVKPDSGLLIAPSLEQSLRSRTDAATQRNQLFVDDIVDTDSDLTLMVGRPVILRLKQAPFRIQIADDSIASYELITEQEISLQGKAIGTTVLNFWFSDPDSPGGQQVLSYLIRVFPDPEEGERLDAVYLVLEAEINRNFPNSSVRLSRIGNQVIVRGQAKDVEEAAQIIRIVSASAPRQTPDAPYDPSRLYIDTSLAEIAELGGVQDALNGANGTGVNANRVNSRVVNLLEIAGVHQVLLKVTVAEVNRSAARAIGAEVAFGGDDFNFFSLLPVTIPGAGGNLFVNSGDFELAINALKSLNLARSLAEPNLVTLNGQPANFQVGGQFPVPVVTGATNTGLQGVEFVPFGVQLSFVPVVTDKNRIRLQLQAIVSTRDESIGTTIGTDTNVAGLNSRNFQTTVELREGQTLAIAGLIQNNFGGRSDRVPFAGDIPVLGRLFSSDSNSFDEQELVVLVTPHLVGPMPAGVSLPVPGSDMYEPDDLEFFLGGRMTGGRAEDYRTPVRTDLEKMKAFRRAHRNYIIGQSGYSDGR